MTQITGVNLASKDAGVNVVDDKGVITLSDISGLTGFKSRFRDAIARHRHWMREEKEMVPA
jgi:catalase